MNDDQLSAARGARVRVRRHLGGGRAEARRVRRRADALRGALSPSVGLDGFYFSLSKG